MKVSFRILIFCTLCVYSSVRQSCQFISEKFCCSRRNSRLKVSYKYVNNQICFHSEHISTVLKEKWRIFMYTVWAVTQFNRMINLVKLHDEGYIVCLYSRSLESQLQHNKSCICFNQRQNMSRYPDKKFPQRLGDFLINEMPTKAVLTQVKDKLPTFDYSLSINESFLIFFLKKKF